MSYEKVVKIETELANAVADITQKNSGVYVPPNIKYGTPLHFAIDNTDFRNDTPNGKDEFHGTGQILFQKRASTQISKLRIPRSSSTKMKFQQNELIQSYKCDKPLPPNEKFPDFTGIVDCSEIELYDMEDQIWAFLQTADKENIGNLPT